MNELATYLTNTANVLSVTAVEKMSAKNLVKAYMRCKKTEGENNGTCTESDG